MYIVVTSTLCRWAFSADIQLFIYANTLMEYRVTYSFLFIQTSWNQRQNYKYFRTTIPIVNKAQIFKTILPLKTHQVWVKLSFFQCQIHQPVFQLKFSFIKRCKPIKLIEWRKIWIEKERDMSTIIPGHHTSQCLHKQHSSQILNPTAPWSVTNTVMKYISVHWFNLTKCRWKQRKWRKPFKAKHCCSSHHCLHM